MSSWTEEQLEQRQRALAKRLSRNWEATTASLDRHQATIEYNRITRTLLALRDRRVDPLYTFPVEIWLHVIKELLFMSHVTFMQRMRVLHQLTAVSTRWRRLLIHEPSLWTQIDTYCTKSHSIQRLTSLVRLCVERSQEAELSVTGFFEDPSWQTNVGHIVLPHMKRIRELVCSYSLDPYVLQSTRLPSLFPTTPALRTLVVKSMNIQGAQTSHHLRSIQEFVQRNPQLTEIQGVYDGMLQPDSHPELSRVTLQCEATQILPILQKLPKLRTVSFHPIWPHPKAQSFDNVPLPWTRMVYKQRNYGSVIRLLGQLRSTLRELHLNIDAQHLRRFLETLQHLKALENLTIELEIEDGSTLLFQSLIGDPPTGHSNVREVKICVGMSSVQTLMERRFTGSPKTFWDWIFMCVPNTETFTLPFVYQSNMVSLTSLPNIRQLHCQAPIRYRLHEVNRCSNLQDLTISCGTLSFPMLSSASVRKLDITFAETHPIAFSATKWPNLTVLYLRLAFDFTKEPITFDLPSLQQIIVHGKLQTVTTVTNSLASHQHSVPYLYHISFPYWYPEMDILFILLERRLLSTDIESRTVDRKPLPMNLEPLKRITISKAIPPHILSLLMDRVQGLFTPRPPLAELSVGARAKNVFDTDMYVI